MAHELERVCDVFSKACQCHMMARYCCDSGSTNKLFCMCFLLCQDANKVILDLWSYCMILEGARLLELHSSTSASSGTSRHE